MSLPPTKTKSLVKKQGWGERKGKETDTEKQARGQNSE